MSGTFFKVLGWICLAGLYAVIALLFGGQSVAQCLGLDNTSCVAAWYASMSPLDRSIHDAPGWLLPTAIFLSLWALTLAIVRVAHIVRTPRMGHDREAT